MKSFLFGFSTYFKGMRLWMGNGKLLWISIIPFLIASVLLVFGMWLTFTYIPNVVSALVSPPASWYQYLVFYGVWVITALGLFFAVIFVTFVLANLLSFPFNDLLAEKTLFIYESLPESQKGIKGWTRKSLKNFGAMFKKTIVLLIIGSFLILATLIPGLGVLSAVVGIFLMACDRLDYSFDHFEWSFKQRVSFVKSNFPEVLGFTCAMGLTTAIPVINMLAMPGSVVAGASLVSLMLKRKQSLERSHS